MHSKAPLRGEIKLNHIQYIGIVYANYIFNNSKEEIMVQKKMSQPKKPDLKNTSREISPEASPKADRKGVASTDKAFNSDAAKKGAKASQSKTR